MKIVSKSIIFCMASLMALAFNFSAAPLSAAWNPSVIVSNPALANAGEGTGPVLTVNASNNGVAVWGGDDVQFPQSLVANDIYAASYTFGSGWGPPVVISDTSISPFGFRFYINQGDPDIRMNASGYVIAVWEGGLNDSIGNQRNAVFSATRLSDGTWSSVQTISVLNPSISFRPANPSVAVNDSGLGVAVWTEKQNGNNDFAYKASFLPFGGTWTTPVQLDFLAAHGETENTPDVEINAKGNVVATWLLGDNSSTDAIHAATYDPLTGLWTTVSLDPNPGTPGSATAVPITGIDDNGNAVVVWRRINGSVREIVAASFTNGTGWGPSVILDSTSVNAFSPPYVVMDHFGTATAVWSANNTGEVFSSILPFGGTWSVPTLIGFGELDPGVVQEAADVDNLGNVIVIINNNGILQSILHTVQGGWQPPENIFNDQRNVVHQNIGIGSCGFALALWDRIISQGPQGTVSYLEAADNFGLLNFLLPPSNFVGSRCCQKFASQTRCVIRLSWSPSPDCVAFYVIRRNGVVVATIPAGGNTTFVDPVCSKNQRFTYTLSTINIFGVESQGVSITVPSGGSL